MPASEKVLNLIKYITCYASDHHTKLTTIQLVKYIYLADLYHARYYDGDTITHFPWAFVYYGPYCSEAWHGIEEAASIGIISKMTYESRYRDGDFNLFSCVDTRYNELRKMFPMTVISELNDKIKKYADDTAQLLDYVYFETEPMMNIKRGEPLDFSKARKPRLDFTVNTPKLSSDDIKKIKYHIGKLGDKFKMAKEKKATDDMLVNKYKDDKYYKALECLEEEPLPTKITGTIIIEP